MRKVMVLPILLFMLTTGRAANEWWRVCIAPYEPLTLVAVFPTDNGISGYAYTGAGGQHVEIYFNEQDRTAFAVINGQYQPCVFERNAGDLPTITLYPLGGTRFTWSVQDINGNWHRVRLLNGELAETPLQIESDGRAFTRLPIRRDQPLDPARYHIFDENGNIAG